MPAKKANVDEEAKRRLELFDKAKEVTWADIRSQSDDFDKSILTYSSAGLGLSLAVIKDIVPLHTAAYICLLYFSWISFVLAILLTILSYRVSIYAQMLHMEHLKHYFLFRDPSYENKKNPFNEWNSFLTTAAGVLFLVAVLCTIAFVIFNVQEVRNMSDLNKMANDGRPVFSITPVERGLPVAPKTPAVVQPPTPVPANPTATPNNAKPVENKK